MNVNTIGECLCKIQYERKYNKVHEIHMKYKKYIGKFPKSMKHKKCIEEIPKIHETQEMYREIPKINEIF